jgi:hemoglobin
MKKMIKKIKSLIPGLKEKDSESDVYKRMGGYEGIDSLVNDFYEIMSTDPEAKDCFATHSGLEIRESAEKLKFFLSGWTGGPPLYMEKYGHPRLRMRHFPFKIGVKEGDQWLYCMRKALAKSKIDSGTQEELMMAFGHIVNMITQNHA